MSKKEKGFLSTDMVEEAIMSRVRERKIFEVPCPNPFCDRYIDISQKDPGENAVCKCGNSFWVPRVKRFSSSITFRLITGFLLSVLASVIAAAIYSIYFL